MKVFVDTSAFYALAAPEDQVHQAAEVVHERLKADPSILLVTTNYILLETVSLLQRRHGIGPAGRFGDSAIDQDRMSVIWLAATQHRAAWRLWKERGRRGLSLVDCSSFIVMREQGIRSAFAFDEQFREAGFTVLVQPQDRVAEPRGTYRAARARR
jgi:predicted nucleic acid-binding protein